MELAGGTLPGGTSSGCIEEREAAEALGYTQYVWDSVSAVEDQPDSYHKYWTELTDREKAAAVVLGYSENTWDKGGNDGQTDRRQHGRRRKRKAS